jgi:hypothetical protein
MPNRASPSRKSPGKVRPKNEHPGEPGHDLKPARARRNDTPEAKTQRARAPKTHPTRAPGSVRKGRSR